MIKREKNIKMIVTDLDGTLLTDQKELTFKTRNILIEKKKHGKIIVLATGRTLGSVKYAVKDISFANYIIANNGASIYDVSHEHFLFENTFSIEEATQIFELYKEKCFSVNICSSNYFYQYTKEKKLDTNTAVIRVSDYTNLIEKNIPVCHMDLNVINQTDISTIVNEIYDTFPHLEVFIMQDSFGDKKWITITKKGVNKSNALTRLQENLEVDFRETVLFGDGRNDIEMLRNNGSGVAMANALPEVKKVCLESTDSNNEDGIIKWLDKNDI